ncbi:hypothetical protein FHX42_005167 [Saccharopolyspora lacisalsi]|uniref:Uncharacterized protein n=1 Tax=Halosaccharopolyspora lacisalsi TaxID=1000566 RepID=A0A839E3Z2_9PSEU|nr:hypothetical protein [Halosaccharopolyspora lacisalsi]MBA8827760.1 hypothetical protein [Halosaccharopolyspora lacisalsi]
MEEVPSAVWLAATLPIAQEELAPAEEERIQAVVHATWRATRASVMGGEDFQGLP